MNIDAFKTQFFKRKEMLGLVYEIYEPATVSQIIDSEEAFKVVFPQQIKWFYQGCNGLRVLAPQIEIYSLNKLAKDELGHIHFCKIDGKHNLSFKTSKINEAGQWDIINSRTGFVITKTMASFWSNKIWAWIDKQRIIW